MVYAGDQWIQLPVKDLYDTQMMAIAINAAKDMYDKGLQEMKEFNKLYGDFTTPILADQDWYNRNVTGRLRDAINEVYRQGGDPLRNPLARAFLSQVINNMPVGEIAKLRTSADNAREFLKAKLRLQLEGKWNPLYEQYDGPSMDTYSTVGPNGLGIWDRISPTPVEDVATFGNPYFEGMKPNIHRESKNGVDYSVESITEQDLKNVADAHFNELVSTPQGQMMFKYYRDLVGGDSNPKANELAREMFNKAIVDGQRRRIYTKDNYDDQWAKREQLKQGWAKIDQDAAELQLKRDQFNWEKDYYERLLSGSGNGVAGDIPTAGAADQVALDLSKQYSSVQDSYYKQLDQNELASYKKLSHGELVLSRGYKKALKDINDPNTSADRKKQAKEFIAKWNANGTQNYKQWVDDYNKSINKDLSWAKYSSSLGENTEWGKEQSLVTLLNKAHEVFQRNNILSNAVDSGIQADMNHSLALTKDEDGNHVGNIGKETDFAPVIEAAMTGNRAYRYNSHINKINRSIKGKPYKITLQNQVGRKYGHGSIGNAHYDVIQLTATFTDESVVKVLDRYTEDALKTMGITKNPNGGYDVPIVSKFAKGSLTWANVNTETDKRVGGVTEATKRRATRQAASIMSKIQ